MIKVISLFFFLLLASCASTPTDPLEVQKARQALMERCQKLKKEIVDLRGKPVRRNAAIKYYESECSALNAERPSESS